jgi:ATP-dependent Lhr-like helicase
LRLVANQPRRAASPLATASPGTLAAEARAAEAAVANAAAANAAEANAAEANAAEAVATTVSSLATPVHDAGDSPALIMAALDPANPFGSALPFPADERGARLQRAEGAKVILHGGRLVAYLHRGGQALWTFLSPEGHDEPGLHDDCQAIARAFAQIASPATPVFITTVDGVLPAREPLDRQFIAAGFARTTQGYLHR